MIYLIPIGSIIYGLLLYYNIFIPRVYHGSAEGNIIFGVVTLIIIPILQKFDDKYDGKNLKKDNLKFNFKYIDKCYIVYMIGTIIVLAQLFEFINNDILFVITLFFMSFCRNILDFIK